MSNPNSRRVLKKIGLTIGLFSTLYVAISMAWLIRPWGNKLPTHIMNPEYAVLAATAFLTSLIVTRRRVLAGFGLAIAGYALGLGLVLLLVNVLWPDRVVGCYKDGWEWYCPGPLPVVTEGWGALQVAAEKVVKGTLVSGISAVAAAIIAWLMRAIPLFGRLFQPR